MRIVDPDCLRDVPRFGPCEYCLTPGWRDRAHVFHRGMGAGKEVDIRCNFALIGSSLNWRCLCHYRHHEGKRPTHEDLLAVVARRERCSPEDIEAIVNGICWRLSKDPSACQIRDWMETLSLRAVEMVSEVPEIRRRLNGGV